MADQDTMPVELEPVLGWALLLMVIFLFTPTIKHTRHNTVVQQQEMAFYH